jgi:hypothetical protein
VTEAAYADISIDQGADFTMQVIWTDPANEPYEVIHPIRLQARAATGQVMLDLTSYADGAEIPEGVQPTITYNSDSGVIQLQVPYSLTSTIPHGELYYDLFTTYRAPVYDLTSGVESSTERRAKILTGKITVEGRVTKDV